MSVNSRKPTDNIIYFDEHRRLAEKRKARTFSADTLELRPMTEAEDKAVFDAMADLEALEDAHLLDSGE